MLTLHSAKLNAPTRRAALAERVEAVGEVWTYRATGEAVEIIDIRPTMPEDVEGEAYLSVRMPSGAIRDTTASHLGEFVAARAPSAEEVADNIVQLHEAGVGVKKIARQVFGATCKIVRTVIAAHTPEAAPPPPAAAPAAGLGGRTQLKCRVDEVIELHNTAQRLALQFGDERVRQTERAAWMACTYTDACQLCT